MAGLVATAITGVVVAWIAHKIWTILYNYFLHPLARFPGPALVATGWYKTNEEVFKARNWTDVLFELHAQYGDVVRIGPNELHFSDPATYHEIYNNAVRWDKEKTLYHSFGEDRSSFGFLTYREAKPRRDIITPFFSKRAISNLQGLITGNIERLCESLKKADEQGKSSDMLFGLRCFTLNTILEYCFAKDVNALEAPDFQHPIVIAMDAALVSFIVFRNFDIVRRIVFSLPGWVTKTTTPELGGLVDLQRLLGAQVQEVVKHPETLQKTSQPIIYHRLLDPDLNASSGGVPSPGSLYEEAQALMFAGGDTAANAMYMAVYHIIKSSAITQTLKAELQSIWPDKNHPPSVDELEKLPYLNAVIKEALRTTPGVPSPLPRIVPATGATLSGRQIPPGTIVGQSMHFVHRSASIFKDPEVFDPQRWLRPESQSLEKWLVAFSRGPRSCLGQNLGMCEMYIAFGWLFRRFDLRLDGEWGEEDMRWRDAFSPSFGKRHVRAFCTEVRD